MRSVASCALIRRCWWSWLFYLLEHHVALLWWRFRASPMLSAGRTRPRLPLWSPWTGPRRRSGRREPRHHRQEGYSHQGTRAPGRSRFHPRNLMCAHVTPADSGLPVRTAGIPCFPPSRRPWSRRLCAGIEPRSALLPCPREALASVCSCRVICCASADSPRHRRACSRPPLLWSNALNTWWPSTKPSGVFPIRTPDQMPLWPQLIDRIFCVLHITTPPCARPHLA
jgi:hypothetical protein